MELRITEQGEESVRRLLPLLFTPLREMCRDLSSSEQQQLWAEYDDPGSALYHHGDEADRPGYTMRELLYLVRSAVAAQRTLALQIL